MRHFLSSNTTNLASWTPHRMTSIKIGVFAWLHHNVFGTEDTIRTYKRIRIYRVSTTPLSLFTIDICDAGENDSRRREGLGYTPSTLEEFSPSQVSRLSFTIYSVQHHQPHPFLNVSPPFLPPYAKPKYFISSAPRIGTVCPTPCA